MPWIARLTVIKKTKGHVLDPNSEPGRHRRGEVVSIKEVPSIPTQGVDTFDHRTFVYVYVTDIPDSRTIQQLKERVLEPFRRTNIGEVHLKNVVGDFTGDTSISEPGGATADVVEVLDGGSFIRITNWLGTKPAVGTVVTGSPSGATGEFESFEGNIIGRKALRIPVKDIPAGHKTRLQNDGWTDAPWSGVTAFFKRHAENTPPTTTRGTGDPEIDSTMEDSLDDVGVVEDITI
jgi:hypothetical protein